MNDIIEALLDPSIRRVISLDLIEPDDEQILVIAGTGRIDLYDLTAERPILMATNFIS